MPSTIKTYRAEAGNAHCANPMVRFIVPNHFPAISGARLGEIVDELMRIQCKHALSPLKLLPATLNNDNVPTGIAMAVIALGLQRHAGCDVRSQGSSGENQKGKRIWWIECWDARLVERALNAAIEILEPGAEQSANDLRHILDRALGDLIDTFSKDGGTASTWVVVGAARKLGIPHHRTAPGYALFNLGLGTRCMRFRYSVSEQEPFLNNVIQHNKALTAHILSSAGISVPRQERATNVENALKAADRIGYPVVVKPIQGQSQIGVEVNIRTPEVLREAIARQGLQNSEFAVERFFDGDNYRFMVARGKITNCYKRFLPEVIGNGQATIRELIEALNRDPERGPSDRCNRSPINIGSLDRDPRSPFRDRGLTLSHVPAKGETVLLSYFWLGTNGGEIRDITPDYHPSFDDIVRRVYAHIPIPICGIDILAKDISAPAVPGSYAINEINSRPALSIFHRNGPGSPAAAEFLRAAIGDPQEFWVPVALMVSDSAEPEIAAVLRRHLSPGPVAHAGHDGYRIGGTVLSTDFHADIAGTLRAMADREADALLLERRPQNLVLDGIGLPAVDFVVLCPGAAATDNGNRIEASFAENLARRAAIYIGAVPPPRQGAGPWPVRAVVWPEGEPPQLTAEEADILAAFDPTDPSEIQVRALKNGTRRGAQLPPSMDRRAALVAAVLQTLPAQSS